MAFPAAQLLHHVQGHDPTAIRSNLRNAVLMPSRMDIPRGETGAESSYSNLRDPSSLDRDQMGQAVPHWQAHGSEMLVLETHPRRNTWLRRFPEPRGGLTSSAGACAGPAHRPGRTGGCRRTCLTVREAERELDAATTRRTHGAERCGQAVDAGRGKRSNGCRPSPTDRSEEGRDPGPPEE
jgi:hypothetical protein